MIKKMGKIKKFKLLNLGQLCVFSTVLIIIGLCAGSLFAITYIENNNFCYSNDYKYECTVLVEEQGRLEPEETPDGSLYSYIVETCREMNSDLSKVFCIYEETKPYYNYNRTNIKHKGSYPPEFTLRQGGVCRDWTELYRLLAQDLGIETNITRLRHTEWSAGHRYINLLLDNGGYCVIDGNDIHCS